MIDLDTETCGFHGPIVLLQWAEDDGPVNLHHTWKETILDTTRLIENICTQQVCGFNLAYDWFHLCQHYTTLVELAKHVGYNAYPEDYIDVYAECEPKARSGQCLKPVGALDLLLYARKGPYQSTMDRRNIIIKKVPIQLAESLCQELEQRVQLSEIYFSRNKDKTKRFHIRNTKSKDFVDIILKFAASSALKVLVKDALGVKEALLFKDVGVPKSLAPVEAGWAPFARALSSRKKDWFATIKSKGQKKKGYTWPGVIRHHIDHWYYSKTAQEYGTKDVVYLQELRAHFQRLCPDSPPTFNDTDSILACMVGAVRWKGYSVDLDKLKEIKERYLAISEAAPRAPEHVYKYLDQVLSSAERAAIAVRVLTDKDGERSTKKVFLEAVSNLDEADCPDCKGEGCTKCKDGAVPHPAAIRAKACLLARQAKTKIGAIDKLLIARRFHVSVNVIGALSGRMSGRDGLNATGIDHSKEFRAVFTLADSDCVLSGGDFVSYEVAIADARYDDPKLRQQLLSCWHCEQARRLEEYEETFCPSCGGAQDQCRKCKYPVIVSRDGRILRSCDCGLNDLKGSLEDCLRKIHGLFAMGLSPGKNYVEILLTKGSADDLYDKGKRGLFSQLYGGNYTTLMVRLNVDEDTARSTELAFQTEYPGVGRARSQIADRFCSMRQPGGIGSEVEWHTPDDYVESLNGFRRYFTLENRICKTLFDLATDPPEEWQKIKIKCTRRDREQRIGSAVRSAVFAAAFNIQSKNMRAAANHEIQSTGARETKDLQREIWDLQPSGVNDWVVQPFQVHDEIMCPTKEERIDELETVVTKFVKRRKSLIPLLRIDWSKKLNSWADK